MSLEMFLSPADYYLHSKLGTPLGIHPSFASRVGNRKPQVLCCNHEVTGKKVVLCIGSLNGASFHCERL